MYEYNDAPIDYVPYRDPQRINRDFADADHRTFRALEAHAELGSDG